MCSNPNPHLVFPLLIISTLTLFSIISNASPSPPATVYQILPKFGLPSGLLPNSVKSYTLNDQDGTFEVQLISSCYIQFDYLVYYEESISGKLSMGAITELKGIQVKRFLFWFDVDEIRVDLPPSDTIYFQVGFINKKLDVDQFETVHSCQDKALLLCKKSMRKYIQLPVPLEDVQMLNTE
ncbi:hypothetical protein Leryth_022637 [Lithospermum erythrorhizon]|nr:hypothetical protein Leryth_022637 [Lithospermum erythrorhizon]